MKTIKSKIVKEKGIHSLIKRYNNYYKSWDYFFRTWMEVEGEYKLIEFELTIAERDEILMDDDFDGVLYRYKQHHDFEYERLLSQVVALYISEAYGPTTPGKNKIIIEIIKFTAIAEEFYNGIIVKGEIPEDGICIKGYSAASIKEERGVSDIQAYFIFAGIIGNSYLGTKADAEKERPKRTLSTQKTVVMQPLR